MLFEAKSIGALLSLQRKQVLQQKVLPLCFVSPNNGEAYPHGMQPDILPLRRSLFTPIFQRPVSDS